jgi:hypothetical protein
MVQATTRFRRSRLRAASSASLVNNGSLLRGDAGACSGDIQLYLIARFLALL